MKKIISIISFLLLSFGLVKSQSIGVTGPSEIASGSDIVLSFTNESTSRTVVGASIDVNNSSFNTNRLFIGSSSLITRSGSNPSKFTFKIFFASGTYTNNESVIIKLDYSYNGSAGAGNSSLNHTISVIPPPAPPLPVGPTASQHKITFTPGSTVSTSSFNGTNWPLTYWLNGKTNYTVYMEASNLSNFSVVSRTETVASPSTFSHASFYTPGGPPNQTPFTQNTYIRMKLVWGGQTFYSNILYVPISPITIPLPVGPSEDQNKLILAPGSTSSSFSITNPALEEYIATNGLNSNNYQIRYWYFYSPLSQTSLLSTKLNVTSADFPVFTQKVYIVCSFGYNNTAFFSERIEIPL
jgi:hypothetical protein